MRELDNKWMKWWEKERIKELKKKVRINKRMSERKNESQRINEWKKRNERKKEIRND